MFLFLLICATVEAGKEECFLGFERLRNQKTKMSLSGDKNV